jgi:hypothetical protein
VGRDGRVQMSAAAATGRALQLRIVGTTGFIFVTFVLRSVFSTLNAVAFQLRDFNKTCPGPGGTKRQYFCDASCYNMYTHIVQWISYTPEFQSTITLLSSPLAQLVALWGMTTKSMLQLIKLSWQGKASALTLMRPNEKEAAFDGVKRGVDASP